MKRIKSYKEAEPIVWGGWAAIMGATLVAICDISGTETTGALSSYTQAALACGTWGAGFAMLKNWFGRKLP